MSKTNQKWKSISIPTKIFNRIKGILGFTEAMSISEYVRFAIMLKLQMDEASAEEQKMLQEEIKERLKE